MKKLTYSRKQFAVFMLFFDYLVFLLSPEDSTDHPDPLKRSQSSRFDGRFHGTVKIVFWIGLALFFWIVLLFLFRMLR